jgi:hypothetical protein
VLVYVVLGGILGAVGQGIRVSVGIKKAQEEATSKDKDWIEVFETKRLMSSLIIALTIGGIAGVLGSIEFLGAELTKECLITLIAVGYAGTDFIEGFARKGIPNTGIMTSQAAVVQKGT